MTLIFYIAYTPIEVWGINIEKRPLKFVYSLKNILPRRAFESAKRKKLSYEYRYKALDLDSNWIAVDDNFSFVQG